MNSNWSSHGDLVGLKLVSREMGCLLDERSLERGQENGIMCNIKILSWGETRDKEMLST